MARIRAEYLIESAALATFMVSACVFGTIIFHPASQVNGMLSEPWMRRVVMGMVMGATAVAIIYSPWGRRSGAHMNPALTLTFFRLGRIAPRDAAYYVVAQFAGGVAGVIVARVIVGAALADPSVHYVVTRPGVAGVAAAFAGELVISAVLMLSVLAMSSSPRTARFTGMVAGILVALFITFEDPLSGMSMNPARTLGSAVVAADYTALWLYFIAPLAGMALGALVHTRAMRRALSCAKLAHAEPCLFCDYVRSQGQGSSAEGGEVSHQRRPTLGSASTGTIPPAAPL